MKLEIKEALALELTKAIIAEQDPLYYSTTSAGHWIKTYNDALEAIEIEINKNRKYLPPATGGKTVFD